MKKITLLLLFLSCVTPGIAQQVPDTTFAVNLPNPTYKQGKGPAICIDSAHNNFHTLTGGYAPFARLMRKDGYKVIDQSDIVTDKKVMAECEIYLIANPIHESNLGNWQLPNPSALSEVEITVIKSWVENGGSLFLIADHMPFAGAASELATEFGFQMSNGFAFLSDNENQPDLFSRENGRLLESPVTGLEISTVTSFTGSAFQYPDDAIPVMVFSEGDYSLEPEIAWQFEEDTKKVELDGYAQGALLAFGEGKIAMFGEAAMFTAQTMTTEQGTFSFGFNSERLAPQNISFLLNIVHWLDS